MGGDGIEEAWNKSWEKVFGRGSWHEPINPEDIYGTSGQVHLTLRVDSAAALIIATSITRDGASNLRGAVADLVDARATTYDDKKPHPLAGQIDDLLHSYDWIGKAKSRVRDEGYVFHVESFVVALNGWTPSLDDIEEARLACISLDWKVQDMVIVLVSELPEEFLPGITPGGERWPTPASTTSAGAVK